MKKEFKVIADLLPNNSRVLDVGCGDGSLMNFLVKEKNIETRGLELDQNNVPIDVYQLVLNEVEPPLLNSVMRFSNNNQSKAARILGLNRTTLRTKLYKYNILK